MTRSLGIDLGLHSIKIAHILKGEPVVITDRNGAGEIPTFVGFGKGHQVLVGQAAKDRWQLHPELIVYSPAMFLGKRIDDPPAQMIVHQFGRHIKAAPDGSILFNLGELTYTPVELTALLFAGIKELAELQTDLKFDHCIISVPSHFGERQVVAVKKAAQLAGFYVQQMINQPTAVALNFGLNWEEPTDNKLILIYSLGSSFDSSVLIFKQGRFTVLNSVGNALLGGDTITEKLARYLSAKYENGGLTALANPKSAQKLWGCAEDAINALSKAGVIEIDLPGFDREGEEQALDLDREVFERLIRPDLEQITDIVRSSLQQTRLSPELIDFVIPVGGSSLIPLVNKFLSDIFGEKKIVRSSHPFHAAACGAAIHTAMLSALVCPHCGKSNSPQEELCRYCGRSFAPIALRRCTTCYLPNDISNPQCWKCGTAFSQTVIDVVPKNVNENVSLLTSGAHNSTPAPIEPVQEITTLKFEWQILPNDIRGYYLETPEQSKVQFVDQGNGTWGLKSHELTTQSIWRGILWGERNGSNRPHWIGTLNVTADCKSANQKGNLDVSMDTNGQLLVYLGTLTPQHWRVNFWQGRRGRLEMKIARNQAPLLSEGCEVYKESAACSFPGCAELSGQVCPVCGKPWCQSHLIVQGNLRPICIQCADKIAHQLLSTAAKTNNLSAALSPIAILEKQSASAAVARLLKGLIFAEQGNSAEAFDLLEPIASAAISTHSLREKTSRLSLACATQRATVNDLAGAAKSIAKAFAFDPNLKTYPAANQLTTWQALSEVINGNLPEAINIWEQEWQSRPIDLSLIHNLAITYFRLASEREAQELSTGKIDPQHSTEILWKNVVAFWSAILFSRSFWNNWALKRLEISQTEVTSEEIEQVRKTIEENLTQDFRNYEDEWNKKGNSSKAKLFHNMDITWGLEKETAKILGDLAQEFRVNSWPHGFSCGPNMLTTLSASPNTKSIVISLSHALPQFLGSSGQRLKNYISPMGRYHYLLDANLLDQAIIELEAVQAWPQAKTILGQAQLLKGAEMLHVGDLEGAVGLLEKAKLNGADIQTIVSPIIELSINFSKENLSRLSNASEGTNAKDLFGQGVHTLDRVFTLVGNESRLCQELAASLALQSRMSLKDGRIDESERLIRRAYQVNPQDVETQKSACVVMFNIAVALADQAPDRAHYYIQQSLNFQNSVEDRKDASEFMFGLARKAIDAKKRQQAVQYMLECLRYNPEQKTTPTATEAKHVIKQYLKSEAVDALKANRERQALGLLEEARNYGDDAELLYLIAIIYGNMGRLEEKVQLLSAAYQANPSDSDIRQAYQISLHNRGVQYANADRYDQAIKDMTLALQIMDSNETRKMLAQCYALRGVRKANSADRYGAISDVDQALRLDPYNSDFRRLRNQLQ